MPPTQRDCVCGVWVSGCAPLLNGLPEKTSTTGGQDRDLHTNEVQRDRITSPGGLLVANTTAVCTMVRARLKGP